MKVLNIGCGNKPSSSKNIDIKSFEWADIADMHEVPFPSNSFDLVYVSHVLEHSSNPIKALNEWQRVAKWLWLIVPISNEKNKKNTNLGYAPDGAEEHYFVLSVRQWKWIVGKTNWNIVYFEINNKGKYKRDLMLLCKQ